MIEKVIEWSVNNRFLIFVFMAAIILAGVLAIRTTPVDAIPDLSDVQVIVYSEFPGQGPNVVEDQVTYPLTTAMLAVPYAKVVRGYSFFGFSLVYIIFEDGTDLYWARSRVLEYLNYAAGRLPQGVTPQLGPDATGVGWVYEYVLDGGDRYDLQQLRSVQDWYLRYELASLPGVSEVASIGGFVKQYQVEVDPLKLQAYNVPLQKVRQAIQRSNNDVGGRLVEMGETEFMVRGLGYIKSLSDLEKVPVGMGPNNAPVLLKDIARIHLGPELRRGIADWNGQGETVGGIIVMRYGENALKVIDSVKKKLGELEKGLPEGVTIKTAYDRSSLIKRAIATLKEKLVEETAVVALVIVIFLLNLSSSFVAVLTLPLAVLLAFVVMRLQGLNANIMSLGGIAIAIGAMVDAVVVMIENAHKHLERETVKTTSERWALMVKSSKEVGPALFYSLLIITLSFMPVFTLQQQEGRLFKPLAFTKTYSMAASALLAITIVPVLMGYFIRGRIRSEEKHPLSRILIRAYRPVIRFVLKHKVGTILVAVAVVLVSLYPLSRIGSEFMPPLNEGDLLYMPTTLPGISVTKAKELLQQTDKIIARFPEVESVFGKIGRADTATDPAPLTMIETTIRLKDQKSWRPGMTMDKLVQELNDAVQFPGLTNAWTMPIKTRIDMLSTGIKTPVGIKLLGPDLQTLSDLGERIEAVVRRVPGTASVISERVTGGNYVDFVINREAAARYGMTVGDVEDIIMSAIGGMNVTKTVEGLERYPVNVRYSRELRDNPAALKRVLIPTPSGAQIPLGQVADLQIKKGPPAIKSENARRTAWLYVDVRDIDVGSYVKMARRVVDTSVRFPAGYSIIWSGQYEYMQRAQQRLRLVLPITLLIIFMLLYFNFRNITESLIIMLSLPFALVGGVWLMWLSHYNMSVAVGVGFIALAGVAAETGVVMLLYIDNAYRERLLHGRMNTREDLHAAVVYGAVERVRPKLMTVTTTIIGLLPIMWSLGTGSQVMKRIAAPMVGGLVTSTVLTLIVIPAIYYLWRGRKLRSAPEKDETAEKKEAVPEDGSPGGNA
jgi:Cu(I)/Ag(I) efflux system membrane protein CusA/SilA